MGGLKRKIPTDEKIEKKESKSVAFSKRRRGLYSKASQLCVLSRAQVAILATPPCSKSNVSFFSFGHSSVDSVVSAFLKNQYPREDHLGSEFWWEDERLAESEDPTELSEAVDSISRMMQNLKGLRSKALANREDAKKKKKEVVRDQSQTLNLQSTCASSSCIHEDPPENLPGLVKKIKEEDQKVAVSDKNNNNKELDGNQTLGFQSSFASICIQDVSPENVEGVVNSSEQKDQIVVSSDSVNNNGLLGNLDGFDQVLSLDDDFIDFQGLVENCKEEDHLVDENKNVIKHGTHQDLDGNQTTGFQSSAASLCTQDVSPESLEGSEHKDQILASSDSNNGLLGNMDGFNQVLSFADDDFIDFEMDSEGLITTNFDMSVASTNGYSCAGSGSEDGAVVVIPSDYVKDNQMVAVSDSNNALPRNLYGCNQEFDIDQIFDFVKSTEDLSLNYIDVTP